MKILELTLFCNDLQRQKQFYEQTLDINAVSETKNTLSFQIGFSKLIFKKAKDPYLYHYCFMIPSNKIIEAKNWIEKKLDLVQLEKEQYIYHFESWNAHSIYFYDGVGNIAEFIVRHDLDNASDKPFDSSHILCLNEIGAPTTKIKKMNNLLESNIQSNYWKGNFDRFVTNGDQDGLFLLVNNAIKKTWFPTSIKTQSSPFYAIIESNKNSFNIEFFLSPNTLKINNKTYEL